MPENLEVRGGVWYYRAMINGKLHRRSTGFKAGTRVNLSAAQRRASEIEHEIRSGALGWVKPAVPLFQVWVEHFLKSYHPDRYTERVLMRRPLRRWADRPLDTIAQSEIRAYLNERQSQGAAAGTLERERVLLAGLFKAAVRDKKIAESPMKDIHVIKTTPRDRVLSRTEEEALRGLVSPMWQRFLTVALTTGLRRGELLGLEPRDLRDGGTWLQVRAELNKTKKARLVPLRPDTLAILEEQAASRRGDDRTPYFPLSLHTPTVMMRKWCKRLKLPTRTPHDLRRTFATRCAEAGMYPKHLQQILGHSSIEMTMKYYVHVERRSVADALTGVSL
jgi:integrase